MPEELDTSGSQSPGERIGSDSEKKKKSKPAPAQPLPNGMLTADSEYFKMGKHANPKPVLKLNGKSSSFGTSNDSDDYQFNNRTGSQAGNRIKPNKGLLSKLHSSPANQHLFRADTM